MEFSDITINMSEGLIMRLGPFNIQSKHHGAAKESKEKGSADRAEKLVRNGSLSR